MALCTVIGTLKAPRPSLPAQTTFEPGTAHADFRVSSGQIVFLASLLRAASCPDPCDAGLIDRAATRYRLALSSDEGIVSEFKLAERCVVRTWGPAPFVALLVYSEVHNASGRPGARVGSFEVRIRHPRSRPDDASSFKSA